MGIRSLVKKHSQQQFFFKNQQKIIDISVTSMINHWFFQQLSHSRVRIEDTRFFHEKYQYFLIYYRNIDDIIDSFSIFFSTDFQLPTSYLIGFEIMSAQA